MGFIEYFISGFLNFFSTCFMSGIEDHSGSYLNKISMSESAILKILFNDHFLGTKQISNFFIITAFILILIIFHLRTRSLKRVNKVLREKEMVAKEVARQKDLLTRRNKNIEDSLNYAHRIQKSIFTTHKQFKTLLPDSFIFHRSKDIVSGDFYWISEINDKVFVAAVDCTGHGVPGAFMSLIGFELFRKIIHTQNIHEPAEILNALNENLNEIFGNEDDFSPKDGMDLAFCVVHKKKNILEFAGAFNPLYILRENKLIEIKGDRFSVGIDFPDGGTSVLKFTSHKVLLKNKDMIYIFTDGYADQFGGPEGKKFKYRRFRHLLLNIHNLPLEQQRIFLEEAVEEWLGNYEQIDDILIIGFKPL